MSGEEYVYAAYGVVLFALILHVVVTDLRLARTAREADLLARLVARDLPEPRDELATDPVDVTRA